MTKRTTLSLDEDLVRKAAEELGTKTETEIVHAALREIVARWPAPRGSL